MLAAEIAIAPLAGRTPEFVFEGRAALKGDYPKLQLAELASALGTLEMSDGNARAARKLFREALLEPTENAVAQVSWAADQFTDFVIDQSVLSTPLSFEARAWTCYHSAQWEKSLAETWYWLSDQPFSARPAVHGSFLASALLEDYAPAIRIGEAGLVANPRDFSLLNNIAVALAKSGEVEKASGVFSRINTGSLSQLNQLVWKATAGLLRFRSNQPDVGRRLYLEAMDKGTENGLNTMTARASVYLANEEIAAKTPQWKGAMVRAHGLTKGTNDPIAKELFNRLLETKKPMDIVAS